MYVNLYIGNVIHLHCFVIRRPKLNCARKNFVCLSSDFFRAKYRRANISRIVDVRQHSASLSFVAVTVNTVTIKLAFTSNQKGHQQFRSTLRGQNRRHTELRTKAQFLLYRRLHSPKYILLTHSPKHILLTPLNIYYSLT